MANAVVGLGERPPLGVVDPSVEGLLAEDDDGELVDGRGGDEVDDDDDDEEDEDGGEETLRTSHGIGESCRSSRRLNGDDKNDMLLFILLARLRSAERRKASS